tara:strand:+ start:2390 stop:2893 length:504 start_codon:yes stop_codon:yes gene_type:complete
MWTVIKYKKDQYNILIENMSKKFGNVIKFYKPKIKYFKYLKNKKKELEDCILGNYVFCHFQDFKDDKTIASCKYVKGIEYFLNGHISNQKQIESFINMCKHYENKDGSISQNFFHNLNINEAKFLNGPFSNLIFKILEKKKSFVKIAVGDFKASISCNSKNYYQSVF